LRQKTHTPYFLAFLSATSSFACDTRDRGPLEIFHGPAVAVGAGSARTELRFDDAGRLLSASVVLDDAALASLPATGSTIEHILPLPADAPRTVFDHVGLDWNPEAQAPPRAYTQPHLGVHFYLIPEQQRNAMTHADPTFAAKAAKTPSQEDMPPDHVADPTGVLRMGTHWLDGRSRSW
jgi:hypothetical protein